MGITNRSVMMSKLLGGLEQNVSATTLFLFLIKILSAPVVIMAIYRYKITRYTIYVNHRRLIHLMFTP